MADAGAASIHVALDEGFLNDTVEIRVDGSLVYRKEGVSTNLQLGQADVFDARFDGESAAVQVEVPSRGVTESILVLEASQGVYLGISIEENGKIAYRLLDEPFGYS